MSSSQQNDSIDEQLLETLLDLELQNRIEQEKKQLAQQSQEVDLSEGDLADLDLKLSESDLVDLEFPTKQVDD